jgi:hypothetical protein
VLKEDKLAQKIASQFIAALDLLILTGVGAVYPMLRTHTLLSALHPIMGNTPLLMFFPGRYDGHSCACSTRWPKTTTTAPSAGARNHLSSRPAVSLTRCTPSHHSPMKIRELFLKPIDRPINGVIKADQMDAASVWQELEEYVVTKQISEYLRKFFDAYLAAIDRPHDAAITDRMGVWVSGSLARASRTSSRSCPTCWKTSRRHNPPPGEKRRAAQFFDHQKIKDAMLLADIQRAVQGTADVILFNIDAKADSKNRPRRHPASVPARLQRKAGLLGRRPAHRRHGAPPGQPRALRCPSRPPLPIQRQHLGARARRRGLSCVTTSWWRLPKPSR